MNKQQAMHYKETAPSDTVLRLQKKLKEMGIEVEEIPFKKSKIGTNSLRIVFKGTDVGTNGKGVNEEYSRASAYAELFERYQNNMISSYPDLRSTSIFDFKKCPDEKLMSAYELIQQNDPFMRFYFANRKMQLASIKEKVDTFKNVNIPDYQETGSEGYISLPFYNVRDKKVYYLPYNVYTAHYGSNGMAAGNQPEEALVQGLSEIIERVSQIRIIKEGPFLPDVPEEYIKKYPYVYEMYEKARNIEGFNIIMKDCSFSGKYPVAGLMIIQHDTGKYGLKLGCHPDFGVAMERTLTEATQGSDIDQYTERSTVDFFNSHVKDKFNISNSFAIGMAQYPFQILYREHSKTFVPIKEVNNKSNREILNDWVKEILEDGYDILIRDVSWLGFPSYHIIIPGLSEANVVSDAEFRAHNTKNFVSNLMKYPEKITEKDCKYIIAAQGYFKGNILLDNNKPFFSFTSQEIPYGTGAISTRYLAAMCYVFCNKPEKALEILSPLSKNIPVLGLEKRDEKRLQAEILYLSALVILKSHVAAMTYMRELLSEDIYTMIDWIYSEPHNILRKIYPSLSDINLSQEEGPQYKMYKVMDKLKEEMMKNPIQQHNLQHLFYVV